MTDAPKPLITPVGIIGSKPVLFDPKLPRNAKPTDKPQFFLRLLFTAADLKHPNMTAIMQAVVEAGRKTWPKFDAMARDRALKLPLRTDIETKGYDPAVFAGYFNIGGYEDSPPPIIGPDRLKFMDQSAFYPGARARASIRLSIYNREDNKGISVKLSSVQWAGHGERMVRGAGSDGSEFDELDVPAETAAAGGADADLMALVS